MSNTKFISYSVFKQAVELGGIVTFAPASLGYISFCEFNSNIYGCKISDGYDISHFDSNFKDSATQSNTSNDAEVLALFSSPSLSEINQHALPVSIVSKRGKELISISHNFCDPTTWYTQSQRTTEILSNIDGYTFISTRENWIDLTHGKLWDEDNIAAKINHGYSVIVTIDGEPTAEQTPFGSGGDFTVDYKNGLVIFFQDQGGKEIQATFSYAAGSLWALIPDEGTNIIIESAKITWTEDLILNDTIVNDMVFYDVNNLPNKTLIKRFKYKTLQNIIEEAESFTSRLVINDTGRGLIGNIYSAKYRYGTVSEINASSGLETRIYLENDLPYGGTFASVTFYCTVQS